MDGQVLSTKYEKLKTNECLVLSNLEVRNRVTVIVEGLGDKTYLAWYCKAYRSLGEDKLWQIASLARTGKNPKTLFGWLLKQEMTK